ncbi:MAG: hypothetical protein ACM30E_03495, partial [Nitrososphaerales archaeon]
AGRGRGRQIASAAVFGLACVSKPTAWFFAPFYLAWILRDNVLQDEVLRDEVRQDARGSFVGWLKAGWRLGWPALVVALLIAGPYFVWNPGAMFDDVWKWSAGTSATAYQIWGWGASNLVLALGWVKSRFDVWPFWLPELLVAVPLMAALLVRQWRANTLARALWSYALFLLAFFFVSRFLNENYLGYVAAFLALGALVSDASRPEARQPAGQN